MSDPQPKKYKLGDTVMYRVTKGGSNSTRMGTITAIIPNIEITFESGDKEYLKLPDIEPTLTSRQTTLYTKLTPVTNDQRLRELLKD